MWLLLAAPAWAIAVAAPLLIHLPFVGESMGGAVVAVLAFAGLALVFPPNHSPDRAKSPRRSGLMSYRMVIGEGKGACAVG